MDSVFKYTAYRPEFFENFLLKASTFGEFNDPFEMVMGDVLSTLSKQEYEEVMESCQQLSDPANYYDYYWDAQCGVRASLAVLCFSSKGSNILMWSHYARNHKGICIEFYRNADFFNGQFANTTSTIITDPNIGILRKVEYQAERPCYAHPRELENDTKSWFVKAQDWAYEEEQRLLLPIEHAEMTLLIEAKKTPFYKINPRAIKSVTLGCQMPADTKKEVAVLCRKQGIKVREAFIHSHQFRLDIVDYDESNQSKYHNEFNINRVTSY